MNALDKEELIAELEEHLTQVRACVPGNPLLFMNRCDLWNVLVQTGGFGVWKSIDDPIRLSLEDYTDYMLRLQ